MGHLFHYTTNEGALGIISSACLFATNYKYLNDQHELTVARNILIPLFERELEIWPRSNRKTPIEYDREAYKRRNLIERCVNRLKQFRRIATRYEKTARAFLSMLCIAAARLWIKTVNTA